MNTIGERLRELRGGLKLGLDDKTKGEQEDKHAIRNAVPISADEFFGNMQEMLGLEQKAQEQSQYDEVLAAIVNNMGQMAALQNTLTELWIEQEERVKALETNYKTLVNTLRSVGKVWD